MQGMELLQLPGMPAPLLPPGATLPLLPPGAPGPLPLLPPAAAAPGMNKPTLLQVCGAGAGCHLHLAGPVMLHRSPSGCMFAWQAGGTWHGMPAGPHAPRPRRPLPSNLPPMQNALKTSSLSRMEELQAYLHRCDDPAYLKNYVKAS